MAPVELTSPVEGKQPGETYSGEREDWLVANGYAKRADDSTDHHLDTNVEADSDPTLAANRGEPDDVDDFEPTATHAEVTQPFPPRPEEQGPVPPTQRPADLEERQFAAEADVKGLSIEEVKGLEEAGFEVDDEATTDELTAEFEGEQPTVDENVEGAAGDGQEVSNEEGSRQDGDDDESAASAQ